MIGNPYDLKLLASRFTKSDCAIAQDGRGDFYLSSDRFQCLTDVNDVRSLASTMIESVNGLAKLQLATDAVQVDAPVFIGEDGKRTHFLSAEGHVRSRGSLTIVGADTPSPLEIAQVMQDNQAAEALRFFGKRGSWVDLYKTLEAVENDLGGERSLIVRGWCTATQLKRFKRTAQSAGDEGRHAPSTFQAPSNPMTLGEGESLIANILRQWLTEKNV